MELLRCTVIDVPGCIAERFPIFSPGHIPNPPPGLIGNADQRIVSGHACNLRKGDFWFSNMFQCFQANCQIKTAGFKWDIL